MPSSRLALWAVVAALAPTAAAQAEPAHIFRLPAEPIDAALVRFAVQARVSIGGYPAPGCRGDSRPIMGVYTASSALRRLLPPGCGVARVDERAFRITGSAAQPPPRPAGIAAPAPPEVTDLAELVVTAEKR